MEVIFLSGAEADLDDIYARLEESGGVDRDAVHTRENSSHQRRQKRALPS